MKYLYGHTSKETAYVVQDYPWGFKLRTQIRYWVESKKGYGQRFGSQTVNPKTGNWCAAKYGTYSPVIVMYLDEIEHIKYKSLSLYADRETVQKFLETHKDKLDDFQLSQLRGI